MNSRCSESENSFLRASHDFHCVSHIGNNFSESKCVRNDEE